MNCMPEELRVHLSDKKITTGYKLAAVTDKYVITHKRSRDRIGMKIQNDCRLKGVKDEKKRINNRIKEENRKTLRLEDKATTCYQCRKVGHIAAKCQIGTEPKKGRIPREKPQGAATTDMEIDKTYRQFVGEGYIFGPKKEKIPVTILREMGAAQSILLKKNMPHGARKVEQKKITIKRIGGKKAEIPLCDVELKSNWKTGPIIVVLYFDLRPGQTCHSKVMHRKEVTHSNGQ